MKREVNKEQYFTSHDLARNCVETVQDIFPLSSFDLVVEPSAGDGSFLRFLPREITLAIDIEPKSNEIIQTDFLCWRPSPSQQNLSILTIGNPPFGARASLALRFISHAATFSNVIAFVLPMSFNKYTFQNMVPENLHLVKSVNCTDRFKTPTGYSQVKTVFQIWEKRQTLRDKVKRATTHPHFQMKHAHLSRTSPSALANLVKYFEFGIAQVGANFFPKSAREITQGSYWFISPNVPGVRKRFEKMDFSDLSEMNVAHMSLSKSDIIAAYDQILIQEGFDIAEVHSSPEGTLF